MERIKRLGYVIIKMYVKGIFIKRNREENWIFRTIKMKKFSRNFLIENKVILYVTREILKLFRKKNLI